MATIGAPPASGNSLPALDSGTRPAYCSGVAMLGLFPQSYMGQDKDPAKELIFFFEIMGEEVERDDGEIYPRILSKRCKYVGGERANYTKISKALDPTGDLVDPANFVGQICQIEVEKKEKNGAPGEFTNKINTVIGKPMMQGWNPQPQLSDGFSYNFYDPTYEEYSKLPRWAQGVVKENMDYPGSAMEKLIIENETQTESSEPTDGDMPHPV